MERGIAWERKGKRGIIVCSNRVGNDGELEGGEKGRGMDGDGMGWGVYIDLGKGRADQTEITIRNS